MQIHPSRVIPGVAALVLAVIAVISVASVKPDEGGFIKVRPEDVPWREEPGYGGLQMAVLSGDPAKTGIYVIRVRFPPGLMTRPHRHPEDRHVTVISGTWYAGEGPLFDPAHTVAMKPGSYMMHPSNAWHFDGAKSEEAVVQIVGYGPSETVFNAPAEGMTGSSMAK